MSGRLGRTAPVTSPAPAPRPDSGSGTTAVEGRAVLRRGDLRTDVPGTRRVVEGSRTVMVDGIPVAREGHVDEEGAPLADGSSTVDVGEGIPPAGEAGLGVVRFHIHVDADRDGEVDDDWEMNGDWRAGADAHGAVLLVNCDLDDRAHRAAGTGISVSRQAEIEPDNDPRKSSPRTITADVDPLDLAPLVLRRDPDTADESHGGWTMTLRASRRHKIRIFDGAEVGATEIIGPASADHFTWNDLGPDERVLAMEATQFPGRWPWGGEDPDPDRDFDGKIVLTLEVRRPDGELDHTEEAIVRASPWIMFNHFDPTEEVFVANFAQPMVPELGAVLAGVPFTMIAGGEEQWVQDVMEPGHTAMPRAGEEALRTVLDPPNRYGTPLDDTSKHVAGRDMGYACALDTRQRALTWDSTGNVECTPPFRHPATGRSYPFGRIVIGTPSNASDLEGVLVGQAGGKAALAQIWPPLASGHPMGFRPEVEAFFRAQAVQDPIVLDTGWLAVGHVDEMICFLPMRDAPLGFRVLWSSPSLALELLAAAIASGGGAEVLYGVTRPLPIAELRAHVDEAVQRYVEGKLEQTINVLKREVGLGPSDFIPLPVIFHSKHQFASGEYLIGADTSDVVNGLVVTHGAPAWRANRSVTFVVPKTAPTAQNEGLEGTSLFDRYIVEALGPTSRTGVTVRFVNAYELYHQMEGEVHCGTNSIRTPPTDRQWWEV